MVFVLKVTDVNTHKLGLVLLGDVLLGVGTFLLAVILLVSKIITDYFRKIKREKKKERINKKAKGFKDELLLIIGGITTIIVLFFGYSYAEASVDKAFNFIGEEIFGHKKEEKIVLSSPAPRPLPKPSLNTLRTPSPAPQKAVVNNPAPVVDPDPIVNCSVHANCGGGTMSLKSSECSNSTCCQIGDKWYFYRDKNKCIEDQKKQQQNNSNPIYTYSPLPFPSYKPIAWPSYEPIVLPYHNESAQTQNYISEEEYERIKADCLKEFNERKQGIQSKYGGATGTAQFAIEQLEKEYQFCFDM